MLVRTVQTEGVSALYRGFGAILVGGTPGTMVYLCGYDWFKSGLESARSDAGGGGGGGGGGFGRTIPESAVPFCAGMLAETLACVIYVPVDVVKERLQVQQTPVGETKGHHHRGSLDAFRTIVRTEGLAGIYKGYGATLASFGPFSALYFLFYEEMKIRSRRLIPLCSDVDDDDENAALPFPCVVLSSAGAGAAASWLTSPLDMAKLRIQIQRGGGGAANASMTDGGGVVYRGMVNCLSVTYRAEGVRGLFRGAVARVLHFAPATAITMTCYETCRGFYARALCGD